MDGSLASLTARSKRLACIGGAIGSSTVTAYGARTILLAASLRSSTASCVLYVSMNGAPAPDKSGQRRRVLCMGHKAPHRAVDERKAPYCHKVSGAPGKTRTSNPQIRSLVLYPIELRAQRGAGCSGTPARHQPLDVGCMERNLKKPTVTRKNKILRRQLVQFPQDRLTHHAGAHTGTAGRHDIRSPQPVL
jgi:hypothetical protein